MVIEDGYWYKVSFTIGHKDPRIVVDALERICSYITDNRQEYWIDGLNILELNKDKEE
jgi:hypothetical protein